MVFISKMVNIAIKLYDGFNLDLYRKQFLGYGCSQLFSTIRLKIYSSALGLVLAETICNHLVISLLRNLKR